MKSQLKKIVSTLTSFSVFGMLSALQCFALGENTVTATGDSNRVLVMVLGGVMAVAVILIIVLSITKKKK